MNTLLRPFRYLRRLLRHLRAAHDDLAARARMGCVTGGRTSEGSIRVRRDGEWIVIRTLDRDLNSRDLVVHQRLARPLAEALSAAAPGGGA